MLGVAFFASIATFWPYNLTPSLQELRFRHDGWRRLGAATATRCGMAALTAVFGTAIIFIGAYLVEKTPRLRARRAASSSSWRCCRWRCPGSCSASATSSSSTTRPIRSTSSTARMAILVICTIAHFYSVAHLTAVDRAEADRPRVRDGVGLAAACRSGARFVARHPAGLPAGRARHRDVSLRQRDDHGLGGGLPLCAGDDAGRDRRAQHGRCRRRGAGGGDGDDDLLHLGRRPRRLHADHRRAASPARRPGARGDRSAGRFDLAVVGAGICRARPRAGGRPARAAGSS